MASSYSELYSLTYTGAVDNSGNGVRAQFDFQGLDRGNSFQVNSTWPVSFDNTDGPMCALMANNQVVSGVTAKILTSAYESGSIYTGTLEMYPLTAGTTYRLQAYSEGGTPVIDITFTPTLNNNPRAKDLASGTLAESISASTTTLLVYVGEGSASTIKAVWPDTPFYASIMPSTPSAGVPNSLDSEIVKVTAVGNDQVGNTALTVVRAQRGTTGKAFTAGAIVTNADYAEDAVLLADNGSSGNPTPWIDESDVVWNNFGAYFAPGTQNIEVTGGNATQIASFTIPKAGKYMFIANCGLSGGDENTFFTATLKQNSTTIGETLTTTYTGTARPFAVVMAQAQCSAGDVIRLYAAISGTTGKTLTRPNGIAIFRIG